VSLFLFIHLVYQYCKDCFRLLGLAKTIRLFIYQRKFS
jgi:hypothetical protein